MRMPKPRVKKRVDGSLGNSGHKYCVHYRCGNKIKPMRDKRPGRKYKASCGIRKSLSQPVEWYENEGQIPKCPRCKVSKWVRDVYRDQKENHVRKCNCNGFPFPHRSGSYALNKARDDVRMACIDFTEAMYHKLLERIDPIPF